MDETELKQTLLNGKKTERIIFAVHPRPQAGGNGHGQAGLRVGKRFIASICGRGGQEGNAVNESDVRLKLIDPVLKRVGTPIIRFSPNTISPTAKSSFERTSISGRNRRRPTICLCTGARCPSP